MGLALSRIEGSQEMARVRLDLLLVSVLFGELAGGCSGS